MHSDFQDLHAATRFALRLGRPLTFSDVQDIDRISVDHGGAWITQARSMEDTFLQRDECFAPAKHRGLIVVEALSAGTVIAVARTQAVQSTRQPPRISLRLRFAQTLRRIANSLDPKPNACFN